MPRKNKDLFESTLDDVVPLKKSKNVKIEELKKLYKKKLVESKKVKNEVREIGETKKQNIKINKYNETTNQNANILKKLKKGKIKIDKKVDLHGCTLKEAEEKFYDEINKSYLEDKRCILFITGMGLGRVATTDSNKKLFYGKIRSNIQNWAQTPEHKNKILSYTRAHISHGGEGSFYVYLRKKNKI